MQRVAQITPFQRLLHLEENTRIKDGSCDNLLDDFGLCQNRRATTDTPT